MIAKLKDQVCSLELSRRLKELGVKQESLFYWRDNDGFDNCNESDFSIVSYINPDVTFWYASAFTVGELGEISFVMVQSYKSFKDHWECVYDPLEIGFVEKKEANARAKMLVYLIENNLMEK